jgi:hypothetical protein
LKFDFSFCPILLKLLDELEFIGFSPATHGSLLRFGEVIFTPKIVVPAERLERNAGAFYA